MLKYNELYAVKETFLVKMINNRFSFHSGSFEKEDENIIFHSKDRILYLGRKAREERKFSLCFSSEKGTSAWESRTRRSAVLAGSSGKQLISIGSKPTSRPT